MARKKTPSAKIAEGAVSAKQATQYNLGDSTNQSTSYYRTATSTAKLLSP
jgi:hypothetical protein